MLAALMNLTLKFYPKALSNVDSILGYAAKLIQKRELKTWFEFFLYLLFFFFFFSSFFSPFFFPFFVSYHPHPPPLLTTNHNNSTEPIEVKNLVNLLRLPLTTFSVVVVLDLQTTPILEFLETRTRKSVAVDFLESLIKHETKITEPDTATKLFDFISPLIHQQGNPEEDSDYDEDEFMREQNLVAASLHQLTSPNPETTFKICLLARQVLVPQNASPKRFVHTLVPLVFKALSLAPSLEKVCNSEEMDWAKKGKELFQFVYKVIHLLKEPSPSLALRLFLQSAQVACKVGFGIIANDFFCEALLLYEGLAHSSTDQEASLTLIISTLGSVTGVDSEKYDALTTKCAHHSARLLKKPDQCRLILKSSHLFTKLTEEV